MLLDKEKASLIIKVVAVIIAVAFVGTLVYSFAPNVRLGKSPRQTTKTTTQDDELKNRAKTLENVLKEDSSNANAWVALGNTYFDLNENEKAEKAYTTALDLNPKQPNVWTDLGTIYFRLQQYDKAIEQFLQAINYEPKHIQAHYNLGVVYRTMGNNQMAIYYWEKFLELEPNAQNAESIRQEINTLKQEESQPQTTTTTTPAK